MKADLLRHMLDEAYDKFNQPSYIIADPIQIPHQFTQPNDIEIAAFLSAIIAWGNRTVIIRNAKLLMQLMDNSPFDFISNFQEKDLKRFENFKHRTFSPTDCQFFMRSLKNIYSAHAGLKSVFTDEFTKSNSIPETIIAFREIFFEIPHPERTQKHIANIAKNAAAKRLNLFLRWMVRNDGRGVDFGLWTDINPAKLYIPLDVHSANYGRKLGLLTRSQNDWKAVEELTENLRKYDPQDPTKYDFALFGMGAF